MFPKTKTKTTPLLMAIALSVSSCSSSTDEPKDEPTQSTRDIKVNVLDYSPAPGQFVNTLPEYADGDTQATMARKATESLNDKRLVTLGAWGGSITLKLAEPIINVKGKPDLKILGNAITTSAEPGIIYVMTDTNGDGIPNEEWIEIKPECHDKARLNISVTYSRADATATADNFIPWKSNDGNNGFLNRPPQHATNPMFPSWVKAESITFTGCMLPDNAIYNEVTGQYTLTPYANCADSYPNSDSRAAIDLDDAIDSSGDKINVTHIDFIKIVTGILKCNGALGECSTEVMGVQALNQ